MCPAEAELESKHGRHGVAPVSDPTQGRQPVRGRAANSQPDPDLPQDEAESQPKPGTHDESGP